MSKVIHPKIAAVIELLRENFSNPSLNQDILLFLRKIDITRTEAIITLHFALDIPIKVTDQYVRESGVFESETIEDTAFQTFKYMFYDPDNPSDDLDDKIRVRL